MAESHLIDCDVDPMVPDGWRVEEHTKGGQIEFDATRFSLYLDSEQQHSGAIVGHELRKKLKGKPVLNANILDYLLAHPNLIPEEWKGKWVFFWGTIYRRGSGGLLNVRFLRWDGGVWDWDYDWLGLGFSGDDPALVLASPVSRE